MTEQNASIGPRFHGSVEALCPDDVLTFACRACTREARLQARQLIERMPRGMLIEELDRRLRCTQCGVRGQAQLIKIDLIDE